MILTTVDVFSLDGEYYGFQDLVLAKMLVYFFPMVDLIFLYHES